MKPDPKRILEEALTLPVDARAWIAEILLGTLEANEDFQISQEWLEEIRRRCAEIDASSVSLLEGDAVLAELRRKYS